MPFLPVLCQWLGRRAVSHASLGTYLAIPSTGITIIFFLRSAGLVVGMGREKEGKGACRYSVRNLSWPRRGDAHASCMRSWRGSPSIRFFGYDR